MVHHFRLKPLLPLYIAPLFIENQSIAFLETMGRIGGVRAAFGVRFAKQRIPKEIITHGMGMYLSRGMGT
jgi:hypothetical protein